MAEEKSIDEHYQKSAKEYEGAWFYRNDSPYQDFLVEQHLKWLDLEPRDKLIADVGAGSCNFSAKLGKAAGVQVDCVEPAATLLEPEVEREGCTKVLSSGEEYFRKKPEGVTKVIVKETVHHMEFDKGTTATVFDDIVAMFRQNGGGRLVIMTRPHDCSHFPFFKRVTEEWKKGQDEHSKYADALRESGCDVVDIQLSDFEVRMTMKEWHMMVRSRFWSCFRSLSDAELEEGIVELEKDWQEDELVFPDRIVFIVATVLGSEEGEAKPGEKDVGAETEQKDDDADAAAAAEKEAAEKAAAEEAAAAKTAAEAAEKAAAETAAKAAEDKPAPAAAPAAAGGKYALDELQNGCPDGVAPSQKEDALKDDDFQTAFKMSRADFEKLPKWKKDAAKKAAKIF